MCDLCHFNSSSLKLEAGDEVVDSAAKLATFLAQSEQPKTAASTLFLE